jgi:hypothetical protein
MLVVYRYAIASITPREGVAKDAGCGLSHRRWQNRVSTPVHGRLLPPLPGNQEKCHDCQRV